MSCFYCRHEEDRHVEGVGCVDCQNLQSAAHSYAETLVHDVTGYRPVNEVLE